MRLALVVVLLMFGGCHRTPSEPPPSPAHERGPELPSDASLRLITDPVPANRPDAALEIQRGVPNPLADGGAGGSGPGSIH